MKIEDLYLDGLNDFKEYLSIALWNSGIIKDVDIRNDFDGLACGVHDALVDSHNSLLEKSWGRLLTNKINMLTNEIAEEVITAFDSVVKECRPVEDKVFEVVLGTGLLIPKEELMNKISNLIDKYIEVQ